MKHFRHDGFDLAYLDHGSGDPILLIHGFASNARVNWESTGWISTLNEAGYRTIAIDNRGHGHSTKSHDPNDYNPTAMAGDALAPAGRGQQEDPDPVRRPARAGEPLGGLPGGAPHRAGADRADGPDDLATSGGRSGARLIGATRCATGRAGSGFRGLFALLRRPAQGTGGGG